MTLNRGKACQQDQIFHQTKCQISTLYKLNIQGSIYFVITIIVH